MLPFRKKVFFSWLWVVLCILSIFLVVPIARSVRNFVEERSTADIFGFSVIVVICIAFLIGFYLLWFRLKIRAFPNYLWLTVIACAYIFFTLKLWKRPEEAVHFLEYGLLGFLLFRALRHHIDDRSLYVTAFLIGALVGIFDEALQWMIPRRIWDVRDIGLNALSCGLSQIAIWKGIRPKFASYRAQPKSIRTLSYLAVMIIILLALSLSNTPARVRVYTESLPFLSFLRNEEPMAEDIRKHRDPEIGVFYSRLTLEELKRIDTERAEEYGLILKEWSKKDYDDFLITFPGYARPFLHEMRVHIFRRNRRFSMFKKDEIPKKRIENLFIAYKENLILEKYFGRTLDESPYKWPQRRTKRIESKIVKTSFYKSPVSAANYFPLNDLVLWTIVTGFVVSIFIFNLWFSHQKKSI
jgi:VanZ family protein